MISKFAVVTILLLLISFFSSGCIKPNGGGSTTIKDNIEVDPSLIYCDDNPKIVDGDLKTLSQITSPTPSETKTPDHPFTIIKFRKPVYVAFIEVYTKDRLPKLNISVANISNTESNAIPWRGIGSSCYVEKEQKKRIVIRSKINMMKLTANWIKDNSSRKVINRDSSRITITTYVIGPEIYEIKFYTNQANGGK